MSYNRNKQLEKIYRKKFSTLYKTFYQDTTVGLKLFIEYLRYLSKLITCDINDEDSIQKTLAKLSIITITIAEYEAYEKETNEKQKLFHWNNFCEMLKQNMGEWLIVNDTV